MTDTISLGEIVRTYSAIFLDANIVSTPIHFGEQFYPFHSFQELLSQREFMRNAEQKFRALRALTEEHCNVYLTLSVFKEVDQLYDLLEKKRSYMTKRSKRNRPGASEEEKVIEQQFRSLNESLQASLFACEVYQPREETQSGRYKKPSLADATLVGGMLEYAENKENAGKQVTVVSSDSDILLVFHELISTPRYAALRESVSVHRYNKKGEVARKWIAGTVLEKWVRSEEARRMWKGIK